MRGRRYRLLPHTADLLVEARGRNLPDLFSSCVEALFSLITDRRRVRASETRTVVISAGDPVDRLFLLLRGALLLYSADGFLARNARVTIGNGTVTLRVAGEPADFTRHAAVREIKAVTAHAMAVRRTPGGVIARFIVDV